MLKHLTDLILGYRNHFRPLGFADSSKTMSIGEPSGKAQTGKKIVGIYVNDSDPLHKEELQKFWWLYNHPPLYDEMTQDANPSKYEIDPEVFKDIDLSSGIFNIVLSPDQKIQD